MDELVLAAVVGVAVFALANLIVATVSRRSQPMAST
jgi:hypothetical protein